MRATYLRAHFLQIATEPVSRTHDLARDDLLAADDRLGVAAQIEDDAASFQSLDDPGHHLADPVLIRLDDLRALSLADLLHDDLLGGLRGDPAEHHRLDRIFDEIPDLEPRHPDGYIAVEKLPVRVEDTRTGRLIDVALGVAIVLARRSLGKQRLECSIGLFLGENHGCVIDDLPSPERLVIAGLAIDAHPHVELIGMAFAGRACESGFDRFEDDLFRNALLGRDDLDDVQNLFAHITRPCGESPVDDSESVSPLRHQPRAVDLRDREAMLDAVLIDENHPVFVSAESAGETTLPRDRSVQSHFQAGARKAGEVALDEQRTVHAGRRDLEVVLAGHRILHVEQPVDPMAHLCAVVHSHPFVMVDIDPDQAS